jgi:uncharacterized membrane protein
MTAPKVVLGSSHDDTWEPRRQPYNLLLDFRSNATKQIAATSFLWQEGGVIATIYTFGCNMRMILLLLFVVVIFLLVVVIGWCYCNQFQDGCD